MNIATNWLLGDIWACTLKKPFSEPIFHREFSNTTVNAIIQNAITSEFISLLSSMAKIKILQILKKNVVFNFTFYQDFSDIVTVLIIKISKFDISFGLIQQQIWNKCSIALKLDIKELKKAKRYCKSYHRGVYIICNYRHGRRGSKDVIVSPESNLGELSFGL